MAENDLFRFDFEGDELHKSLGGGLPKGSIVVIEASPGKGKSILAQRVLYGLLRNKHSVSYVSTELSVQNFFTQMDSLNYAVSNSFLNEDLKFVSVFPLFSQLKESSNLFSHLFHSKKVIDSQVLIIDMLDHVLVDDTVREEEAFELVSQLKKLAAKGKSIMICVDTDMVNRHVYRKLQQVADIHLEMNVKEQYGVTINIILVRRFNGASDNVALEIPFKVRAGIGIVPEIVS